jgi:hypothetical protein
MIVDFFKTYSKHIDVLQALGFSKENCQNALFDFNVEASKNS